MKQGQIIKSAGAITQEELACINTYTRRNMTQEEIYTFSVVLCDNDVDRDFECFDEEALHTLKALFVGKTGVFDHDPKAQNQTARIYDCYVEQVKDQRTQTGKAYMRLVGKAYLPRSKRNEDLILSLDSGIQKEVSVGCAVREHICSVCGKEMRGCTHQKGKSYGGKLCYATLHGVTDAYEWSFVAVPAQRQAGVIKAYKTEKAGERQLQDIIKSLCKGQETILSAQEAKALYGYIQELEQQSAYGKVYREDLKSEVLRLSMLIQPEIARKTMESLTNKMDIEELKAFYTGYREKSSKLMPQRPQLYKSEGGMKEATENIQYNI